MASTAEGHRNITMFEDDWQRAGVLGALMTNRSVAIRMAVRFAAERRTEFLNFVLTQGDIKPAARRSIESALTTTHQE